jgi:hypothetical protein
MAPNQAGGQPTVRAITTLQPQITSTGNTNLLTAPAAAGGNPGTKAISDLIASPAAQSTNHVLLAASTKGAAPALKPLSEFMLKADLPDVAFIGTLYSAPALATLNAAANKVITGNFNGTGMTYNPWVAVKRSATQWDWMGMQNGHCENGTITSAGMTRTAIRQAKLTGTGALFTWQRSGNQVWIQCSGRAVNAALAEWATIVTIPAGYRPFISTTMGEDSMWIKGSINGVISDFQMFSDGRFRSSSPIASGSQLIIGSSYITDNGYPDQA